MKNKKCRAKFMAAHKKRVAAWRKKRERHMKCLKKCKKSKKCWMAHLKRVAAHKKRVAAWRKRRERHMKCMKNKKCRAKFMAAHKKRVAAWRKKRERRMKHHKRQHARRHAARMRWLKKCKKSKKCWM